jgi:hypothetical protein
MTGAGVPRWWDGDPAAEAVGTRELTRERARERRYVP